MITTLVRPREPLSRDEERAAVKAAKKGDQAAIEALCASFDGLIANEVLRHCPVQLYQDGMSAGYLGLMKGIERTDLRKKTSFWTYARHWVRAEVLELARTQSKPVVLPHADKRVSDSVKEDRANAMLPPKSLDRVINAGAEDSSATFTLLDVLAEREAPPASTYDVPVSRDLLDHVAGITRPELRALLTRVYDLDGQGKLTITEYAREAGISGTTAFDQHKSAVGILRRRMGAVL